MDGLALLAEARAAGLEIQTCDGRIVIRGPRSAEPIARRLIAHKADVLQALAIPDPFVTPADLPAGWHFAWDERAAIMEYEGKMPKEHAEAAALADILRRMREAGIDPRSRK